MLDDERNELDDSRDAIDKATVILLDQGKMGVSLGLDSAVHEIGKALQPLSAAWTSRRTPSTGCPKGLARARLHARRGRSSRAGGEPH